MQSMDIFSYIKERISIFDVACEYVTLKEAGLYWKGHCPFHHEKTASFTVSPHKGIFYCFGCHRGGDVISLIVNAQHCSPIDAAKYLADRYQIVLPTSCMSKVYNNQSAPKDMYVKVCNKVALWCHATLLKNPSVLQYLQKRGINLHNINQYKLGYFPGGLRSVMWFVQCMEKHAISLRDLVDAHIISEGKKVLYSSFEERIIFPIKNYLGEHCGFGGRIYKENDQRPKYYNSHESSYFAKRELLFGFDCAKPYMQKTGIAFLVEGYIDCIMMTQSGFNNTVATLGTACSFQHLKLLSRYVDQLYITYDGDKAGRQAVLKLAELCWKTDLDLKIVALPPQEDPASFLAHNHDLQPLIKHAKDIFLFFIQLLGEEFSTKTLSKKAQTVRLLLNSICMIDDKLKQDFLLQRAVVVFSIPFDTLRRELDSIDSHLLSKQKIVQKNSKKNDETLDFYKNISNIEKKILFAIINNMQLIYEVEKENLLLFLSPPIRSIVHTIFVLLQSGVSCVFDRFFKQLDERQKLYVTKGLLEQNENINEEIFGQLFFQLQKKKWKRVVQETKIKLMLVKQEGNEEHVKKLLTNFLHLKKRIMVSMSCNKHINKRGHVSGKKDD